MKFINIFLCFALGISTFGNVVEGNGLRAKGQKSSEPRKLKKTKVADQLLTEVSGEEAAVTEEAADQTAAEDRGIFDGKGGGLTDLNPFGGGKGGKGLGLGLGDGALGDLLGGGGKGGDGAFGDLLGGGGKGGGGGGKGGEAAEGTPLAEDSMLFTLASLANGDLVAMLGGMMGYENVDGTLVDALTNYLTGEEVDTSSVLAKMQDIFMTQFNTLLSSEMGQDYDPFLLGISGSQVLGEFALLDTFCASDVATNQIEIAYAINLVQGLAGMAIENLEIVSDSQYMEVFLSEDSRFGVAFDMAWAMASDEELVADLTTDLITQVCGVSMDQDLNGTASFAGMGGAIRVSVEGGVDLVTGLAVLDTVEVQEADLSFDEAKITFNDNGERTGFGGLQQMIVSYVANKLSTSSQGPIREILLPVLVKAVNIASSQILPVELNFF